MQIKTYKLCGDCRAAWVVFSDHHGNSWWSRHMSDPDAQEILVQISTDHPSAVRLPDDIDHT